MTLLTTEREIAAAPKAAGGALSRRLGTVRDMLFVLGAWMGSWAVVILAVKGLSGLL